jgi:uncharacterized protein YprB with RNaseH-like and TPR domain
MLKNRREWDTLDLFNDSPGSGKQRAGFKVSSGRNGMIRYSSDLKRELEALKRRADEVFRRRTGGRLEQGGERLRTHISGKMGESTNNFSAGSKAMDRLPPGRVGHGYSSPGKTPPVPSKATLPDGDGGPSRSLGNLVPGEQFEYGGASFYRVLAGARDFWEDTKEFYREYLEILSNPFPPSIPALGALRILQEVSADKICYLDIETTGLGGVPLFLVGLMYTSGGRLVIDQLFARDYTEESAILRFLKDLLQGFEVLVTFNGIRFDMPFIKERMAFSGIDFSPTQRHVDLLPIARRIVKERTPNHKLQTLEVYLLCRKRIGDVSGSEIPDVYHEFVRTGDAGGVKGVFHHNRLDLLTMLQLVTVFLSERY